MLRHSPNNKTALMKRLSCSMQQPARQCIEMHKGLSNITVSCVHHTLQLVCQYVVNPCAHFLVLMSGQGL